MQKQYYKEVIKALKQLKFLRLRLRNLVEKLEIKVEESKETEYLSAVSYDSIPTSKTNKLNSTVENQALWCVEIDEIEKEIKDTKFEINRLEQALNLLNDVERKIIEGAYINYVPLDELLEEIKYERRMYYNIKDVALSKLCTSLYGVRYYKIGLPLLEGE